jgi:hypothetical protein
MNKREIIAELNEEALFADGFDEAIVGMATRCGMPDVVVYDREKCIEILAREMPLQEAEEFYEFNVVGAYVGENTPLFIVKV